MTVARRSQVFWGNLFILPALTVYVVFLVLPLIGGLGLSVSSWDGLGSPGYAGLRNFQKLIGDGVFWSCILHNCVFALYTIVFGNILALGLALLLEGRFGGRQVRGRGLFRFLLFSQFILSWVVVSFLWKQVLNPFDGLLNTILRGVGLGALAKNWLGDPSTALASIAFASIWKGFGFGLVVYSASIQGISEEISEAARIDGASQSQINLRIVIPLLKPIILIVVMLNLIDAFRVVDPFVIMATHVPMKSVQVIGTYIYKSAFDYYQIGYSAALSAALLVIVAIISVAYFRMQRIGNNA